MLELEVSRLQLRDVEYVVQNAEQRVGAMLGRFREQALFVIEGTLPHQSQRADDAIQGSADFVAHVGEELRFSHVRRLRGLSSAHEFGMDAHQLHQRTQSFARTSSEVQNKVVLDAGLGSEEF